MPNPPNITLKRVALLTDGIWPYRMGGMQKHSFKLAQELARAGIEVDLYHCPGNDRKEAEALTCFSPEERKHIHGHLIDFPQMMGFPGHYLAESSTYSKHIYAEFQKQPPPDLIFAQGLSGWEFIRQKKKGTQLPPIAVHPHGLNMFQPTLGIRSILENWLFRPFFKFNLINADIAVSLGGKLTDILKGLGIPASKILYLPNAVEEDWILESMPQRERGPTGFVFIGRFDKVKGIDSLYEAIQKLITLKQDFRVDIIGPFPPENQLKSPKVQYHGTIREEAKMKSILDQNDVLVLPSISEGLPTVILEAMSRGIAIIASDVGAVSELVSEENGWLMKAGNAEGLIQAMQAASAPQNEDLLQKQQSSWTKMKDQWPRSINLSERIQHF